MTFAKNLTSYPDCAKLFQEALASKKGIRVKFPTHGEAVFQGGRLNSFRVRHRRENGKIYPAEHPLHNASEYDAIMVRIKEESVELVKLSNDELEIQEL